MTQLIPCPDCHRHVRQTETSCPFCRASLALQDVPAPALPRSRLGRAATFAFGATLAGASVLAGCGGESEEGKEGKGGSASGGSSSGGSSATAGASAGGSLATAGTGAGPVYGAPEGGTGTIGGTSSSGGDAVGGGSAALYGGPPLGGAQNATGGNTQAPVYGAAPAQK